MLSGYFSVFPTAIADMTQRIIDWLIKISVIILTVYRSSNIDKTIQLTV